MPLWKHTLEIARVTIRGADTGDYQMLLTGALAHDIGKSGAAATDRKVLNLNHAIGGSLFLTKLLGKATTTRDALAELVKNHHGEIKGFLAEKIKAAHRPVEIEIADFSVGAVSSRTVTGHVPGLS